MNRHKWEKQVFASNMNTTARMVALVVGTFGNWTEDREVWPSMTTVGEMAGMSRETAAKYVTALVEQKWLRHVKTLPGNGKVYELLEVDTSVVDTIGILAKSRKVSEKSRANLKLSMESTTGCGLNPHLVVDSSGPVVDGIEQEHTTKHTTEHTREHTTTVAAAPVDSLNSTVKGSGETNKYFLNPLELRALEDKRRAHSLNDEQVADLKRLIENNEVAGRGFNERLTNALEEIGVDTVEW